MTQHSPIPFDPKREVLRRRQEEVLSLVEETILKMLADGPYTKTGIGIQTQHIQLKAYWVGEILRIDIRSE